MKLPFSVFKLSVPLVGPDTSSIDSCPIPHGSLTYPSRLPVTVRTWSTITEYDRSPLNDGRKRSLNRTVGILWAVCPAAISLGLGSRMVRPVYLVICTVLPVLLASAMYALVSNTSRSDSTSMVSPLFSIIEVSCGATSVTLRQADIVLSGIGGRGPVPAMYTIRLTGIVGSDIIGPLLF